MENQTLQRQFRFWTIFLVVVPSLFIMTIYTVGQIKVAKQQNLEMINQRVHAQERLIDYWMVEQASDVRRLSQEEAFQNLDEQKMKGTLDLMQQDNKNFDSLSYIDKDGFFRMSTFSKGIKYSSAAGKPYFETAKAGKEYISDVVIGRNSGQPIINFSSPIYDYTGNFQGLILGSIRTITLEALLRENWIGQTGEIFLVNREGIMLTEPRYLNKLINRGVVEDTAILKFKLSEDTLRHIRLDQSGTATWIDYVGDTVLSAYEDIPERGWTLIGKINEAEVLGPIYRQLAMMAGGTVLLILLMLPLATLITNRIKLPIDWLIRQSNQVAIENYEMFDQDHCLEDIPKELSNLCETFIDMNHKVQNTIGLLKENEAKLESKVLELRNSELDNRALVESIPDGLLRISSKGEVLSAKINNKRISSIFEENQLIGRKLGSVIPHHIAELFSKAIAQALLQGELQKFEYEIDDNGVTRYREVRIVPTRDDTILAVIREITEQKKAAEALENIREEIVNAQRMASLGIMAGSIAHEMNQPLNSIKVSASGMLYLMENGITLSKEDLHREFSRIVKESERIDQTISKTRWIVREGLPYKGPLLIDEVLFRVLMLIKEQDLFKNIKIDFELAMQQAWITGNQTQMEQLLFHLLTNAAQALKEKEQQEKTIHISIQLTDKVIVSVADNGPGIDDAALHEIFEPFYTTKRTEENMGLGLAIVKSITYAHNGEIIAENNSEGGAIFRVSFPLLGGLRAREGKSI